MAIRQRTLGGRGLGDRDGRDGQGVSEGPGITEMVSYGPGGLVGALRQGAGRGDHAAERNLEARSTTGLDESAFADVARRIEMVGEGGRSGRRDRAPGGRGLGDGDGVDGQGVGEGPSVPKAVGRGPGGRVGAHRQGAGGGDLATRRDLQARCAASLGEGDRPEVAGRTSWSVKAADPLVVTEPAAGRVWVIGGPPMTVRVYAPLAGVTECVSVGAKQSEVPGEVVPGNETAPVDETVPHVVADQLRTSPGRCCPMSELVTEGSAIRERALGGRGLGDRASGHRRARTDDCDRAHDASCGQYQRTAEHRQANGERSYRVHEHIPSHFRASEPLCLHSPFRHDDSVHAVRDAPDDDFPPRRNLGDGAPDATRTEGGKTATGSDGHGVRTGPAM